MKVIEIKITELETGIGFDILKFIILVIKVKKPSGIEFSMYNASDRLFALKKTHAILTNEKVNIWHITLYAL
jgi:hypothetical protein